MRHSGRRLVIGSRVSHRRAEQTNIVLTPLTSPPLLQSLLNRHSITYLTLQMAKSSLAVALLLALGASGAVAQGFQESTVTPLNDTTTACDWCKINANLVPGEPKDLPAASYMYERASMTASSNEAANATILMTQKSAVQAGPVGQSGSYLVDRLLAEREGRLVYWASLVGFTNLMPR